LLEERDTALAQASAEKAGVVEQHSQQRQALCEERDQLAAAKEAAVAIRAEEKEALAAAKEEALRVQQEQLRAHMGSAVREAEAAAAKELCRQREELLAQKDAVKRQFLAEKDSVLGQASVVKQMKLEIGEHKQSLKQVQSKLDLMQYKAEALEGLVDNDEALERIKEGSPKHEKLLSVWYSTEEDDSFSENLSEQKDL
jgi:hypothetical protein